MFIYLRNLFNLHFRFIDPYCNLDRRDTPQMPTAHPPTPAPTPAPMPLSQQTAHTTYLTSSCQQAPRSRSPPRRTRLVLAQASFEVIRKTFAISGLARAALNAAAIEECVHIPTYCAFRVLSQIPTSNAWPASPAVGPYPDSTSLTGISDLKAETTTHR
jgi:hypothetical protein